MPSIMILINIERRGRRVCMDELRAEYSPSRVEREILL
jgi:hypothetical protein